MRVFRLRWRRLGGHVHVRVFQTSDPSTTWQKNGDLVFDEEGWEVFQHLMLAKRTHPGGHAVLVDEDDPRT